MAPMRFRTVPLFGKVILAFTGLILLLVGFARLSISGSGEPGPLARPFLTNTPARSASVRLPVADAGHMLPGVFAVHDVHAAEAGWTLLDRSGGTVGFVGADGIPGEAVGRHGQGPGELESPGAVARVGDQVGVLDLAGTRLDILSAGSTDPVRVTLASPECTGTLGRDLASDDQGWLVLRRCLAGAEATSELLRVDRDLTSRVLARESLSGSGPVDPFLAGLLVVTDGGVYIGSTRLPCLRRVEGTGPESACMTQVPLNPLPPEMRQEFEATIGARARAAGLEVELPASFPAFVDLRPLADGRWAVRRIERDGSEVWILERLEGARIRLRPEEGLRVEPGPSGLLLLRHETDGLRAWVVPFPTPDRQ